ncbi:MAG: ABC transporter permease, partial [Bacteroidia bacterium]|nr:FtsX-like permease family protein [Bacteroidia bacterium]NNM15162.1 ABC transporter permease [Bacteroidia bacterium]
SKALAEYLNVKLKSKVVLTMQDKEGNITQVAFKIVGLFETNNAIFDEAFVFARANDLIRECELDTAYHELAIYLNNPDDVNATTAQLAKMNPNALVEDWRKIAPELELIESASGINLFIVSIIIMVALLFSIINTMLMAVLERYKELGVLMAIGLNKLKVFYMIVLETIMLSLVGGPLGLLIGYLTIEYFQVYGIDFSRFSEGLREFGVNAVIRPIVQSEEYFILAGIVIITAIIGAIYPAIKAIRLKPVEAIRKI